MKSMRMEGFFCVATGVLSYNVPSASLPMVCLIILSVAQTIGQMSWDDQ